MAIVEGIEKMLSLEVKGEVGFSSGVGFARCGKSRAGGSKLFGGIYQTKHTREGRKTSRMRYYRTSNPQTDPQQAWRANMATMWGVYNTLTSDEKLQLSREARRYRLSGPQLFASRYLKSQSA